jgi:hypothetical protein
MEDADDYSPAEKRKLAKEQEIRIAKHIVDHHPNILNEIMRLLSEDQS